MDFVHEKSVMINLRHYTNILLSFLDNKQFYDILYYDFIKAFDRYRVSHNSTNSIMFELEVIFYVDSKFLNK